MILAELAMEAGLPNGVLNMVHGTNVSSDNFVDLQFFSSGCPYLYLSRKV